MESISITKAAERLKEYAVPYTIIGTVNSYFKTQHDTVHCVAGSKGTQFHLDEINAVIEKQRAKIRLFENWDLLAKNEQYAGFFLLDGNTPSEEGEIVIERRTSRDRTRVWFVFENGYAIFKSNDLEELVKISLIGKKPVIQL